MAETAAHNRQLGGFGEDVAAQWYESAGYRVLDRNWRWRSGELDLVATCGSMVAFVEVKTRSSDRFGSGAEAVDHRKRARVRTAALRWLQQQDVHFEELRFDVVEVDRRGWVKPHLGCF